MKKDLKKAFTVIELVIVIAISALMVILAILASTLGIQVGYESSDQNQVDRINSQIKNNIEEVLNIKDENSFYEFAESVNLSSETFHAKRFNRTFNFDLTRKIVIYVSGGKTISYPEAYKGTEIYADKCILITKDAYESYLAK